MAKLLYDLMTTQPTRSSRFHGGGAYGQRYLLDVLEHPVWKERGIALVVARNPDAFLPDEIADALKDTGVATIDVRDHDDLLSKVETGDYQRFYTPISDWLHERSDIQRLASCDVRATVHQLRNLDAPADPFGYYLQPSLLKRTYRRVWFGGPRRQRRRQRDRILRAMEVIRRPILTVSNHSKYQILTEVPGLEPDDLWVVDAPIPDANPTIAPIEQLPQHLQGRKYLFVPNANRASKNVVRLLAAVNQYEPRALESVSLVLSGLRPPQFASLMKRYPRAARYVLTVDALDTPVFNRVIHSAVGLLYPSVSEGFGYPPLEAMNMGTPVLASSATSIVETAGDAALYFNPYSLGEIAARINWFLSEPQLRAELVERGYQRVAFYRGRRTEMADRFAHFLTEGMT